MANVWRKCTAKGRGEQELAKHLSAFDDPKLHLFFSIGFIPGAREIDLVLVHEAIGAFVIEVKAVPIEAIRSVSPAEWAIDGRDGKENPIAQAYSQYEGLRDFLLSRYSKLPFIAVTACFPRISRRRWSQAFSNLSYASSIADGVLFEEDLYFGLPVLLQRLRSIFLNPPARTGREPRDVKADFLRMLCDLVTPVAPQIATITEREKLRAIESGITAALQRDYPADVTSHAILTGRPGTGKTFRLLSIGSSHAYSGKRVLFVCFNKTLASDVRRLLGFSERLSLTKHKIDVLDINQLALRCFEMNGIGFIKSDDADEWGKLLVEELREAEEPLVEHYDTVLVDEAQDMKAWQLDLLECHAAKSSSVVIALGQGQELYQDAASAEAWLRGFSGREKIEPRALRQNFRNQRAQYFVAEAFYDAWPTEYGRIEACAKRILRSQKQDLIFDRTSGEPPRYYPVVVDPAEFVDMGRYQDEVFGATLAPIFQRELEELLADGNLLPVSLLILVPSQEGLHARAARIALKQLTEQHGVGFIDYTLEENRRASAAQQQVRLCTFHSARGLEGERAVVVGLEAIETVADIAHAKPQNLAFIALSRGVFSTTLVVRTTPRNHVHELCERILQVYTQTSISAARDERSNLAATQAEL
jgi:hypothetical protein